MNTAFEQQVRQHFRWNYAIIAGVEGLWGFGAALVSTATILPVFLRELGASSFAIGLLPGVFAFFLTAPQLLAARMTRRLPLKKYVFTCIHYPGCLGLLPLALFVAVAGTEAGIGVVWATFVWLALFGLTISFAMPMWVNLMAKLFPADVRGRSFGDVFLLGNVLGAAGSVCAAWVLARLQFPGSFALLFLLAGVVLSGCVTSFFWLREPMTPASLADAPGAERFAADVMAFLRGSPDFRWFLAARFVGAFSLMATAFYSVAAIDRLGLDVSSAGEFGAILLVSRAVGSAVAGRLGDRFGFRIVAMLGAACDAGAALLAIVAPSRLVFCAVFVLLGMRGSFGMIGHSNLSIEYCPTADKTTFVALGSTAMCPAYVLSPTLGGLLATYHPAGYDTVFPCALVCSVCALVIFMARVREPRKERP